jgi:hypothetical protein
MPWLGAPLRLDIPGQMPILILIYHLLILIYLSKGAPGGKRWRIAMVNPGGAKGTTWEVPKAPPGRCQRHHLGGAKGTTWEVPKAPPGRCMSARYALVGVLRSRLFSLDGRGGRRPPVSAPVLSLWSDRVNWPGFKRT